MWSVVSRLEGFIAGMQKADAMRAASGIATTTAQDLRVDGLSLDLPAARPLLTMPAIHVAAGDRLLIRGRQRTGQTTSHERRLGEEGDRSWHYQGSPLSQ